MRHVLKSIVTAVCVVAGAAHAAAVNVVSVTATGTYFNSPSLVNDGVFPAEGWDWTNPTNMFWLGQEGTSGVVVTMTFDQTYLLQNATYSFDNNDAYRIQVSKNGSTWFNLVRIEDYDGNGRYGMDTSSTDPMAGDDYVEDQAFAPALAKYARVFARGGDGYYSIGEVQFSGTPAVPEPGSIALTLAGAGVVGLLARRRTARR